MMDMEYYMSVLKREEGGLISGRYLDSLPPTSLPLSPQDNSPPISSERRPLYLTPISHSDRWVDERIFGERDVRDGFSTPNQLDIGKGKRKREEENCEEDCGDNIRRGNTMVEEEVGYLELKKARNGTQNGVVSLSPPSSKVVSISHVGEQVHVPLSEGWFEEQYPAIVKFYPSEEVEGWGDGKEDWEVEVPCLGRVVEVVGIYCFEPSMGIQFHQEEEEEELTMTLGFMGMDLREQEARFPPYSVCPRVHALGFIILLFIVIVFTK